MYYTVRIKNSGNYMGYSCPVDGLLLSDFTIQLLRAMGADVEVYDPEEERRAAQAKRAAAIQVQAEVKPVAENSALIEELSVRIHALEKELALKESEIARLKTIISQYEVQEDINAIEVETAVDPKSFAYNEEDLKNLTMAELKTILLSRGHTAALYDKLAPRTKDRRPDLIRKVLLTNPVTESN